MEWIKLKDKLPKRYENVLFSNDRTVWVGCLQTYKKQHIYWCEHPDAHSYEENTIGAPFIVKTIPTHWTPLPDYPED